MGCNACSLDGCSIMNPICGLKSTTPRPSPTRQSKLQQRFGRGSPWLPSLRSRSIEPLRQTGRTRRNARLRSASMARGGCYRRRKKPKEDPSQSVKAARMVRISSVPSAASVQRTKARPGAGPSSWVQGICNIFSSPQLLVSRLGAVRTQGICELRRLIAT